MTDPKDVPEHSLPGTQKQDGVSSGGEVRPTGPARSNVDIFASSPATQDVPASAKNDDDVDPMARLTEIVSQTGAQQAQTNERILTATAPQAGAPQQPVVPAMPPLVAVPAIEIAAEDRPAAPPPPLESVKSGKSFSLFRRKVKVEQQEVPAAVPDEPQPVPAQKGFWSRRKEARAQRRQAEQHHHRTARAKRWARRRRRLWLEELLGWVFVPVILVGIYYGVIGILTMLGTTPEAMLAGFKTILAHF